MLIRSTSSPEGWVCHAGEIYLRGGEDMYIFSFFFFLFRLHIGFEFLIWCIKIRGDFRKSEIWRIREFGGMIKISGINKKKAISEC